MSVHRPPRGNCVQVSLERALRNPHSRSAARKQNTKRALCHWKTRLGSRCFRAWRAYQTVQTNQRRVFWNHVAIVRGKLAVRCRCFRRWAGLPAYAKARKEKMRIAYRHAYLRTVKLTFTQWVDYCQTRSAPNDIEKKTSPEDPSILSIDGKRLAAKAMLRRALVKLQHYTAHRAVRAGQYRLARRQWYMFHLRVSFRKMVANVDDEKSTQLKVQEAVLRGRIHIQKLCLLGWYDVCAPNIQAIKVARKSQEERLKRNAIFCLRRMRRNTLLSLRKAAKSLKRGKLKRQFGAWASVVAVALTYRHLDSIATRHFESTLKRSTLATWRVFVRTVADDRQRVRKASDFHRLKVSAAAVRVWKAYAEEMKEWRRNTMAADKLHARHVATSALRGWRLYFCEALNKREAILREEEMSKAKAIQASNIINISSPVGGCNARVIVKAKRPAPRTADEYLLVENDSVALTGANQVSDELPQLLLPWSVIKNGQNCPPRYNEDKITPNAMSPSKERNYMPRSAQPTRAAEENLPAECRRRNLFAKYSKQLVELNEQASKMKLPDLKLLVEIERTKQKVTKYKETDFDARASLASSCPVKKQNK
eukprot:g4299.t1